jgi:menaquinone-9 beta-reductase
MRDRYDVIVVGARVGGATLAALLGDAGASVLLLDRARFPSTTSSTHFFRGNGMVGVLERLGVLDAVLELGCPPLGREFNYSDGGTEASEDPPQDPGTIGYCLSVRRAPLDHILVQRACAAGSVELIERATVADVLWDDGRVVGVTLGDGRSARASVVVGADGRRSLVAKRVAPAVEHRARPPARCTTATSPASADRTADGRTAGRRRVLPARRRARLHLPGATPGSRAWRSR